MNTASQILTHVQIQQSCAQIHYQNQYRQNQYPQNEPRTEASNALVFQFQKRKLVPREEKLRFPARREMSMEELLKPEDDISPPPILNLPFEIIQAIASYLPLTSAVALALSCHKYMYTLGPRCFEQCSAWENVTAKHALMELLARDSEEYIHCYSCTKLRKIDYRHGSQRECPSPSDLEVSRIIYDNFRFIHVQIAMKLHRLGKDASPALGRLVQTDEHFITMHQLSRWPLPCITHEARIDGNEFLYRSQYCMLLPLEATWNPRTMAQLINGNIISHSAICAHLCIGTINILPHIIPCLRNHIQFSTNPATCRNCRNVSNCVFCGTEYGISLKDYGTRLALVVTRWLNLGPGLSPDDVKWKRVLDRQRVIQVSLGEDSASRRWEGSSVPPHSSNLSDAQEKALFDLRWN